MSEASANPTLVQLHPWLWRWSKACFMLGCINMASHPHSRMTATLRTRQAITAHARYTSQSHHAFSTSATDAECVASMWHSHVYSVRLTRWALLQWPDSTVQSPQPLHHSLAPLATCSCSKVGMANILYGGSNTTATSYQCQVQLVSSVVFSGMPNYCT